MSTLSDQGEAKLYGVANLWGRPKTKIHVARVAEKVEAGPECAPKFPKGPHFELLTEISPALFEISFDFFWGAWLIGFYLKWLEIMLP